MKMNNFVQRTLTGAVFAAVVLGATLWNFSSFLGLISLVCILSLYEFIQLFNDDKKNKAIIGFAVATGFMVFISATAIIGINDKQLELGIYTQKWLDVLLSLISNRFFLVCCWLIAISLLMYFILSKAEHAFKTTGYIVLSWFYVAIPLACFVNLYGNIAPGYVLPLSVIFMVWASDTFAYLTGKLIGKHKIAPQISPGKTWEGFFGGIIFTAAVSVLLSNQGWLPFDRNFAIFVGTAVSVSGFLGDLAESYLKRKAGIKDSGNILPGHGGILDRFDALLFATPIFYLIYNLYMQIHVLNY